MTQSRYREQVERYCRLFPARSILLLQFECFRSNPDDVMQVIFSFLGLPPCSVDKAEDAYNVSRVPRSTWKQAVFGAARRRRRALKRVIPASLAIIMMKLANRKLTRPALDPALRQKLDALLV